MVPSPTIELVNCGVAESSFEAARTSLRRLTSPRRGPTRIVLFDGESPYAERVLADGTPVAYDVTCLHTPRQPAFCAHTLLWRLSTSAALRLDGASAFAKSIVSRHPRLISQESNIAMSLQEAIGNAVLHGNLDLKTAQRGSLEGLAEFAAEMERRIKDPAYACRPVTIGCVPRQDAVLIWVDDCGKGFTPMAPKDVILSAGGGNGLAMIRALSSALAIRRGGRRIVMAFQP